MTGNTNPRATKLLLVLTGLRKGRIVEAAEDGEKTRKATAHELALAGRTPPKKDK